jgi:hypothetical protein
LIGSLVKLELGFAVLNQSMVAILNITLVQPENLSEAVFELIFFETLKSFQIGR